MVHGSAPLSARNHSADVIKAKILFQFTASAELLSVGEYEFHIDLKIDTVRIASWSMEGSANVLIMTRLAAKIHSTTTDAHIVFDKIREAYALSELWEPENDGILRHATKGKHEHPVVYVPR